MTTPTHPQTPDAAIQAAYEKATPGLWGWCTTGEKCNAAMLGTFYTFDDACTPIGGHVERYDGGKMVADWDEDIAHKEDNARYADFDFIATAHNHWPAVAAELARLREENAALRGVVERLPLSADGVRMTPDLDVWVRNGDHPPCLIRGDRDWLSGPTDRREWSDTYSTEAAAALSAQQPAGQGGGA